MTFLAHAAPRPEAPPFLETLRHSAVFAGSRTLDLWRNRSLRSAQTKIRRAPSQTLRLNTGRLTPPASQGIVIGGAVKLIALRERFGESFEEFNLLYLVSSALPPAAETLVREAKAKGIKIVWNQNGTVYPACADWRYPWSNESMARLLPLADYVVYQSEFCHRSADRYAAHAKSPSEVLLNPVDLQTFAPTPAPSPAEGWKLLAAGTSHGFYRIKASLDCLAELVRRKHNVHLTIAGEFRWPGGNEQVSEYIANLGIASYLTRRPPFSRAEAPTIYRGIHVLLHPKYKDPCPTVPIEAMACGLPVIGSASGGMPELVSPSCGRLISVPDSWLENHAPGAFAMADAVEEIFADYPTFSIAARVHAIATFDETHWLDRHEQIFRRVLS